MASFELRDIVKIYSDGHQALYDVSLDIPDGEFLVFVGPSGCGKSTLLRLIAGLEEISAGTLLMDGQEVNDWPPQRRNIAMVFQNYALYPHMTVRRNLDFPLRMAKMPAEERERRVRTAAGLLGLEKMLDRRPAQLSGGERQRVAMGRAVVRNPSAFLMDEPLSNLDAKLRVQIRTEIASLQRELGTTTVYVTHDQVEAMTLGARVAVLKDGYLQQVDTPQALYRSPANAFVAGFLGNPGMNILPVGDVEHRDGALGLRAGDQRLSLPAIRFPGSGRTTPALLGVRPESLHPVNDDSQKGEGVTLRTRVSAVESLGHEQLVYGNIPGLDATGGNNGDASPNRNGNIVFRADADDPLSPGDEISVSMDPRRVYLFDASGRTMERATDAVGSVE
ncbi:MAG: ATP-binding cassette domain-containing protein [Pseudomonadota bacterium]|nr:ATP-binding cassette domain-containing protein [Pseudomonadota bacterium]